MVCTAMQVEEFGGVYGNAVRGVPVVCTAMQVEEFGNVYCNAGRGVRWGVRQCR